MTPLGHGMVVPTANHAEWLEARQRYLTASDVGSVMGLSPYGSRNSVLKAKLSPPRDISTSAMRAGQFLEDGVFEWWLDDLRRRAEREGAPRPVGARCRGPEGSSLLVAHPDVELSLAASPDGVVQAGDEPAALVEVKLTNPDAWGKWADPTLLPKRWSEYDPTGLAPVSTGRCPLRHWVQLQVQLLCTGLRAGWVVGACGTVRSESRFDADVPFQQHIRTAARQFALDLVAARAQVVANPEELA